MRENILERISELECVDVTEAELNMSIHDELREAQNFTAQMESISEAGLLALLRCQGPKSRC